MVFVLGTVGEGKMGWDLASIVGIVGIGSGGGCWNYDGLEA